MTKLAITTVTYNNRRSLPEIVNRFLIQTVLPPGTVWFLAAQNCSDKFIQSLVDLCKDKVVLVVLRFEKNLGLSKCMQSLIELTKMFDFVLNLEDDWYLLDEKVAGDNMWLLRCLVFMEQEPDTSTIFLRAYHDEAEKKQYGWTSHIPYQCHVFDDNFNYQTKIDDTNQRIKLHDHEFSLIPTFLFTFNPCLIRNSDYHKHVYPLPIFDRDSKHAGSDMAWGNCEALAMERTRSLVSYWYQDGVFGHGENWFPIKFASA